MALKVQPHEVLQFVRDYHRKTGYGPSVRDLAQHLEVSTSTAHRHLRALLKTEEIRADQGRSRTWRAR